MLNVRYACIDIVFYLHVVALNITSLIFLMVK